MFNVKEQLEKNGHTILPFSITYRANRTSEYSSYFASPLGNEDQVYFAQQKMTPITLMKTLSRLFYSQEVEKKVTQLIKDTQPDAALVLHYLRKLSPSLITAIKKQGLPIIVRLSDFAMLCPEAHCLRNKRPCTLCTTGDILSSVRYGCVQGSRAVSMVNALATWFHKARGYFNQVDLFMTTNPFMTEMMLKAGWPPEKLCTIPTFTDTTLFLPSVSPQKDNYICYSGRLEQIKGISLLIDAFTRLKQNHHKDLRLKIAGAGSEKEHIRLQRQIDENGMTTQIDLMGHLNTEKLVSLLGKALITVIPSICFENLPNTLIESYACGTPVLGSDIGSMPHFISAGQTGDLFQSGNVADLTEKLSYLTSRPEHLSEMGKHARQDAMDRFSPQAHISQLENNLFQLIAKASV